MIVSYIGWLWKLGSPFWGTLNIRCRTIFGTQRRTIILTTTYIEPYKPEYQILKSKPDMLSLQKMFGHVFPYPQFLHLTLRPPPYIWRDFLKLHGAFPRLRVGSCRPGCNTPHEETWLHESCKSLQRPLLTTLSISFTLGLSECPEIHQNPSLKEHLFCSQTGSLYNSSFLASLGTPQSSHNTL